jgi:hypothetical protein
MITNTGDNKALMIYDTSYKQAPMITYHIHCTTNNVVLMITYTGDNVALMLTNNGDNK